MCLGKLLTFSCILLLKRFVLLIFEKRAIQTFLPKNGHTKIYQSDLLLFLYLSIWNCYFGLHSNTQKKKLF